MINKTGNNYSQVFSSQPANKKTVDRQEQEIKDNFTVQNCEQRDWTVLIYSSATADIDQAAMDSTIELEKVGSDKNLALVLQKSRNPIQGSWKGVRRYFITRNNNLPGQEINSAVLKELGDMDMSRGENLADFVKWGMKKFPARHYMLVMGGHGAGFMGAVTDMNRQRLMPLPEMKEALDRVKAETGEKPDILAFNSCFMAQAEVLTQLRNNTDFIIASEKPEYEKGLPLASFAGELKQKLKTEKNFGVKKTADILVDKSKDTPEQTPVISSVDTRQAGGLADAVHKLGKALIKSPENRKVIIDTIKQVAQVYVSENKDPLLSDFRDLGDFATKIVSSTEIKDKKLKKAASAVSAIINQAVSNKAVADFSRLPEKEKQVLKKQGVDEADYSASFSGVSIYLPAQNPAFYGPKIGKLISDNYKNLDFANKTCWFEFIEKLHNIEFSQEYNP
ncbi:MAG: clostripain-related cysteine peptidase, partial [Vulcanimicrobiota bacterium]